MKTKTNAETYEYMDRERLEYIQSILKAHLKDRENRIGNYLPVDVIETLLELVGNELQYGWRNPEVELPKAFKDVYVAVRQSGGTLSYSRTWNDGHTKVADANKVLHGPTAEGWRKSNGYYKLGSVVGYKEIDPLREKR